MLKALVAGLLLVAGVATAQIPMRDKIVLSTANTVVFRGVVDAESVQKAQLQLAEAVIRRGGSQSPIYLVLDSPGGSIEDGLSFIEFAKTIPGLKTITLFSASMASAIVEALPGERLITNNGYLMFHRASGGFQGQFEDGEVERRFEMAKRLVRSMEQVNASRMRLRLEDYKGYVKDELWLDAEQSLAWRAADRIVDIYCTQELLSAEDVVQVQMLFFSGTLVFSRCPLLRSPKQNSKNVYQVPSMSNFDSILRRFGLRGRQ